MKVEGCSSFEEEVSLSFNHTANGNEEDLQYDLVYLISRQEET